MQDGRIYIELINGPFLFREKGSPDEYEAGLDQAIERGWLVLHESGTHVKFTQSACLIANRGTSQQKSPGIADGALIQNDAAAYLRVAHMYMLISMPTGTSTIFGAFQAIWLSFDTDELL